MIVVEPGARIVLLEPDAPQPLPSPRDVYVRPDDCVSYGAPRSTPQPLVLAYREPHRFIVLPGSPELRIDTTSEDFEPGPVGQARRLAYVTARGLVHVIAAPFPGLTRTGSELPGLIEVVPWIVALGAAVATAVRRRRQWRDLFFLQANLVVLLFGLALSEGNVGVLVRHRSMAIPFAVVLAAPVLLVWSDRVYRRVRGLGRIRAPNAP